MLDFEMSFHVFNSSEATRAVGHRTGERLPFLRAEEKLEGTEGGGEKGPSRGRDDTGEILISMFLENVLLEI